MAWEVVYFPYLICCGAGPRRVNQSSCERHVFKVAPLIEALQLETPRPEVGASSDVGDAGKLNARPSHRINAQKRLAPKPPPGFQPHQDANSQTE